MPKRKAKSNGASKRKPDLSARLEEAWRVEEPWLLLAAEWITLQTKSLVCNEPPEVVADIARGLNARILPELIELRKKPPKHLLRPGGLIRYLRNPVELEILTIAWKRRNPNWDLLHRWTRMLAAMQEPHNWDAAQEAAQQAIIRLWELHKESTQNKDRVQEQDGGQGTESIRDIIPYLSVIIRNKLANIRRGYVFLDKFLNKIKRQDGYTPSYLELGPDFHKLIEKIKENDEASRELVEAVQRDQQSLDRPAAQEAAQEDGGNANGLCTQAPLSSATETKKLAGFQQHLLERVNQERDAKHQPREKIEHIRKWSKRMWRRIVPWMRNELETRARGVCCCRSEDCSCHSQAKQCGAALDSNFKIIDFRGSQDVDPRDMERAFAVCCQCGDLAGFWEQLQTSYDTAKGQPPPQIWGPITYGLREVAKKNIRSRLTQLQRFHKTTEGLDEANPFVRMMREIEQGREEEAISREAAALVAKALADFFSGNMPYRENPLRKIFIAEIYQRLTDAYQAIKSAAFYQAPKLREEVLEEKVTYAHRENTVVPLLISCDCLAEEDESGQKPKGYIKALVRAAVAPGPKDKTVACKCGKLRSFKSQEPCTLRVLPELPDYRFIKGNYDEEEDGIETRRKLSPARQMKIERALSHLHASYQRWVISQAAV